MRRLSIAAAWWVVSVSASAAPVGLELTAVPGAPGTATPTPYPQITPSQPPKAGGVGRGAGSPSLPAIPRPGPPSDSTLPGLSGDATKDVQPRAGRQNGDRRH